MYTIGHLYLSVSLYIYIYICAYIYIYIPVVTLMPVLWLKVVALPFTVLAALAFRLVLGAYITVSPYLASRTTMAHLVPGGSTPAPLPASAYKDGTILTNMANHNMNKMKAEVDSVAAPVELRFCTVCSGSEVFVIAMATLMNMYRANGIDVTFIYTFGCEIKPVVQEWIIHLLSTIASGLPGISLVIEPGCLFAKAEDLCNETAFCKKHNRHCKVIGSDLCAAGTSCKDFSRASSSYEAGTNISDMPTSVGGSADTLHGLVGYLMLHLVSIIIWENVENIDEDIDSKANVQSHLENITTKFHKAGFASQAFLTDAHVFGYHPPSATSEVFGMDMGYYQMYIYIYIQTVTNTHMRKHFICSVHTMKHCIYIYV